MQAHEGEYARVFRFTRGGETIEDLSQTTVFGSKNVFNKDWVEYQRERAQHELYQEDPSPYGSYRDGNGFLKTPRQKPTYHH